MKVPAFGQLSANSEKAALLILYLGVNAAKQIVVFTKFEPFVIFPENSTPSPQWNHRVPVAHAVLQFTH
jgi:hypothetical protein